MILKHEAFNLLNKLHHGCLHGVLKFLEQLIEHLKMDDSAVEERTPTRIQHLWKFQVSEQLFSNTQPRLTVF